MESKASAKPDNNLKNDSEFDKFLNAAQQEEAIRKHKFSYNAPTEEPDLSQYLMNNEAPPFKENKDEAMISEP